MGRETFKKVITSDELISQINPKNIKMVERFLKDKNTRCSDTTIKNYQSDANIFFVWNLQQNENKFFVDIKKIEFADFFNYAVEELQWGSARFARMKSFLSSFSDFIEKYFSDDYPQFRNVILKVIENMPRQAVREKSVFTQEEIDGLMNYLENEKHNLQEACLLALAISSGARVSEWLRFTTDIIDVNNTAFGDIFIETTKKIKTKGRTKTGKVVEKYLIKDIFVPRYEAWMKERAKIMEKKGQNHNSLFIKKDGTPATIYTIRAWIKKWDRFLEKPFYPHALRHYTCTHLAKLGASSELIVEIFKWSSVDMVSIYNDISAKEREWKELDKLKDGLVKKE